MGLLSAEKLYLTSEMGMARWQSDIADGSISMETAQPTTPMSSADVESRLRRWISL
jgi:hypothetical protein